MTCQKFIAYFVMHAYPIVQSFVFNRAFGQSLGNEYGEGEGQIWLDDLRCVGTETNLADCGRSEWGRNDCGHHEDVSISCKPGKTVCTVYEYHLNDKANGQLILMFITGITYSSFHSLICLLLGIYFYICT